MDRIFFNAGKHHLQEMAHRIANYVAQQTMDTLIQRIKGVEGVTDVYVGDLSEQEIKQEVFDFLHQQNVLEISKYREYLENEGTIKRVGHYVQYELSDKSLFTLRLLENDAQFVHIHPSRYSPHTFRIPGNRLKVSILSMYLSLAKERSALDLEVINEARELLSLSPVDTVTEPVAEMLTKIESFLPT